MNSGTKTKAKAKTAVRIVLKHPGRLAEFGYVHVAKLSAKTRRAALDRAAQKYGWLYLVRRLNVLYIFNKNKNPSLASKFKSDRDYASAKHRRTMA